MKILLSILNWNQQEKTVKCLKSILKNWDERIILSITDNNSINFDKNHLCKIHPQILIFQNSSNLGFAGGHQKAIDYAISNNFDFIWLLNNDTTIEEKTLTYLLEAHKLNGDGIYGSIGTNKEGEINNEVIWKLKYRNKKAVCSFIPYSKKELANFKITKVANLLGYSLLIPTSIIKKHRFMDSSFFLYFEETEYCLYLLSQGIYSFLVTNSRVIHEEKGSSKDISEMNSIIEYYLFRNLYRILLCYAPKKIVAFYLIDFFKQLIKSILNTGFSKSTKQKFQIHGIMHAFLGIKNDYYKPEKYLP